MQIHYSQPLGNAWQQMKQMLLNPLQPGKWFALGFTAWIASIADGGGSYKYNLNQEDGLFHYKNFHGFSDWTGGTAASIRDYLADSTTFLVVGIIFVLSVVLGLLLMWVSSRGKFMFLDNVVHDRTKISEPWNRFAHLGDSLFLWQIVYSFVVLLIMGLLLMAILMVFVPMQILDMSGPASFIGVIVGGTLMFMLIVTLVYIDFFLTSFVVPIMYKEGLSTTQAWNRFLEIFRQHPGSFILYGLFYGIVFTIGFILYIFAGLLTCCLGLAVLVLPYIGTVITLPLSVTARFFDLEFLRQFGPEYDLLETNTAPEEEY